MRRGVLCLVVCAVPLVAWAGDGGAKAGVDAGNRKFEEGVAKGDAAALAKLYAPDAEILPPGGPKMKGREAIQKAFGGMLSEGVKKIALTTQELHPMGNLALEVSSWRIETADGKSIVGKALVLWKKNGKTWELYRDIWNEDNPPPPPPAPSAPATTPVPPPATK